MRKTCVYVDGFNLYYGILAHYRKAYPKSEAVGVKWLDINALVKNLLHDSHDIVKINYFTAEIKDPSADLDFQQKITRQRLYIRALESNSNTSVIMGCFKERQQTFKMPDPPFKKYKYKTFAEKGTDVNIATWILRDAFKSAYDSYVLISNDTDLRAPLILIKNELACNVGIICPQIKMAESLKDTASFYRKIDLGDIRKSQFPDNMTDSKGDFKKPKTW